MRSRVASRTTRTSPCLRRKLEISSAGDSAAIAGNAARSRLPATAPPIARNVVVPQVLIAYQAGALPAASPLAMWTLQGAGPALACRQVRLEVEAVTQVFALLQNVFQEGAVLIVL